jgi:O-antigen/teichoic acid export membrane protein
MFGPDLLYLLVSSLQLILSALATPLLTRRLGPTQFGQLALVVVASQIISPVVALGLPFAVQREHAATSARFARAITSLGLLSTVAGTALLLVLGRLWAGVAGIDLVINVDLAALWGGGFAASSVCLALFRSQRRLAPYALVGTLQSVGAQVLGLSALFVFKPTVTNYLAGVVAGQLLSAVVGAILAHPVLRPLLRSKLTKSAIAFALPLVPQQLSSFLLNAGDRLVVRHDLGSVATGRYAVAYNVGSLGIFMLAFGHPIWLNRIFSAALPADRAELVAKSRNVLNVLLVPVVLGIALGGPLVLMAWAPPRFHPLSLTTITAIIAVTTFAFSTYLGNLRALMSGGETVRAAMLTLLMAAANILLNVIVVPFMGIVGSALATLVTYSALAFLTRPRAKPCVPGTPPLLLTFLLLTMSAAVASAQLPSEGSWLLFRVLGTLGLLALLFAAGRHAARGTTPELPLALASFLRRCM